jgi:hypothetical protein
MANLANQKTLLQIQQQLSALLFKLPYPVTAQDGVQTPGQTELLGFINDAYNEICGEKDWRWRFVDTYNFPTVAGQQTPYAMPDDCSDVIDVTIPFYQQRLWATEYSQWITNYPGQYTNYANAKPWSYIQAPYDATNHIQLYLFPAADAPPTGAYQVHVAYMKRPTNLANPGDIMICPPEFQDLVINRAIMKGYLFLGDPKWEAYNDQTDSTFAGMRYSQMWVANSKFAEALAYWRNIREERSFTASLDINRVLFSYGG